MVVYRTAKGQELAVAIDLKRPANWQRAIHDLMECAKL